MSEILREVAFPDEGKSNNGTVLQMDTGELYFPPENIERVYNIDQMASMRYNINDENSPEAKSICNIMKVHYKEGAERLRDLTVSETCKYLRGFFDEEFIRKYKEYINSVICIN